MIKKLAKRAIYGIAARNEKQILAAVSKSETVSFDIFDTLLKRDVSEPQDVFALLEKQIAADGELKCANFAALRVDAERQAKLAHSGRDITLEEIYEQLPLAQEQRKKLMEAECAMELAVSTSNISMKQVYDACIRQGKKVLFISDMYLPTECIEALLRKNGYTKGKLYVSSQVGVTKHSGELFRQVAQAEGLVPKTWVHIGDSISSDWLMPRRNGVRSVLISPRPSRCPYIDRKTFRSNDDYRQLNHFIDIRIDRYTDPYERIGYAVMGPLLYGFARWLEETVPEEEMMVFLARDAAIMQRAFDVTSARSSIYFYTSRNAVRLPSVYCTKGEAEKTDRQSAMRVPTLREVASRYSLSEEETYAVSQKCGVNLADHIRSYDEKQKVLKTIVPLVQEKAQKQYELLQQYLLQEEFPQQCALVDIGWNGTIQKLLTECEFTAKKGKIKWSGYYLGAFEAENNPRYQNLPRKQYLFEKNVNRRLYDSVKYSRFFFELLFLATHGSTKGYYQNEEGRIEPRLEAPDNLGEMNAKINRLQNAAIQFVADMSVTPLCANLVLDARAAAGNYVALARVPTLETLELFKSFEYEDGRICRFVSMHGMGYYLIHWRAFYQEFVESPCKAWFLKSVFKVKLPYIQALKVLKGMMN